MANLVIHKLVMLCLGQTVQISFSSFMINDRELEALLTQLHAQSAQCEREISQLQYKLSEIRFRIGVLESARERLNVDPPPNEAMPLSCWLKPIISKIEPIKERQIQRLKPRGKKTVIEMAQDVLRRAKSEGQSHLTVHQITCRIRDIHWPEAETRLVSPQLWRAAKKGNIFLKVGNKYALGSDD